MIAIVCVDEKNGMCFNKRRQSKDRVLRERVLAMTEGGRLWMTPYSQKQFAEHETPQICVSDAPWEDAHEGEYCFVETCDPKQFEDRIEQLVVFCWNRTYPADVCCSIELNDWKKVRSADFEGYSHEMISEEVYKR